MEPERQPGQLLASSHGRRLLAVVCLRVHVWRWMARRRGGGAGNGELWNSPAAFAAATATAATTAVAAGAAATTAVATSAAANTTDATGKPSATKLAVATLHLYQHSHLEGGC